MNLGYILGIMYFVTNITCVFSLIFIERREVETTWAWLLILTLLPGLGFFIYLALGQNLSREKIFRKKTIKDETKSKGIREHIKSGLKHESFYSYIDLIRMNYKGSKSEYTIGNEVTTFTEGEDKFKKLISDIKEAESFIHIEYYIFRLDDLGKEIVEALGERVKAGVEVRLLVDGMGSRGVRGKGEEYIRSLGIKFSVFFPGITRYINLRINYRNHRKLVIIDGQIGYVGGFNVGNEYVNKGKQFSHWRDTHVRIKGEAVKELNKRFTLDWDYAASDNISNDRKYFPHIEEGSGTTAIQIVSSGPDNLNEHIKYNFLKMINKARNYIYIQSPYLVLDKPMIEALKISAQSGVDIRIMVPDQADHFYMKWALGANIGNLIDFGIKFYRYEKGFIHSKTLVVDGLVTTVGSANFDIRSFKLNFEANAIIYDSDVAKEHEEIFLKDQKDCRFLTKEEYNNRGTRFKICESIVRLLSPML